MEISKAVRGVLWAYSTCCSPSPAPALHFPQNTTLKTPLRRTHSAPVWRHQPHLDLLLQSPQLLCCTLLALGLVLICFLQRARGSVQAAGRRRGSSLQISMRATVCKGQFPHECNSVHRYACKCAFVSTSTQVGEGNTISLHECQEGALVYVHVCAQMVALMRGCRCESHLRRRCLLPSAVHARVQ